MASTVDSGKIAKLAKTINTTLSADGRTSLFEGLSKQFEADQIKKVADEVGTLTPEEFAALRKKVKGAKKGQKRERDLNAPKGARNAFSYFAYGEDGEVARVKAATEGITHKDAMAQASATWKAMSEEAKAPFAKLAADDKTRFDEANAKYKAENPHNSEEESKEAERKEGQAKKTRKATPGKERKKRAKKNPNAPKGPCNAFMWFSGDERKRLVAAGVSQKDAVTQTGARWKTMTAEEKKPFQTLAERDQARYKAEMEKWHAEHPKAPTSTAAAEAPTQPIDAEVEEDEDSSDTVSSSSDDE
jgi:hypothetical protein